SSQGQESYTETFMYFSTPEDGARYTKGWFKVVPGYYLHEGKYEDGDNYWYYADGKGHIVASEIKTIKSKKYLFDNYGRMKKGLQFVDFGAPDETKAVAGVYADDDYGKYSSDFYGYDTEDNFDATAKALASKLQSGEVAFMFFSNDEDHDGSMKTGKQSINIDGDTFTFKFYTSGARKGQGISGVDDKKIYMGGKMIAADADEKINFYVTDAYTGSDFEIGEKVTVAKLLKAHILKKDSSYDKKDETKYIMDTSVMTDKEFAESFVCVNHSGTILTSGTKKDGDDYKIHLAKVAGGATINGKVIASATISDVILK
ncbi:MAG: hypothetical protein IJM79_04470, partial [Erysipelotrichaceae bacterium]|nr:hypothetical protein [Erysipelotrichaceae bacterium]